jgi:hypothetical protein
VARQSRTVARIDFTIVQTVTPTALANNTSTAANDVKYKRKFMRYLLMIHFIA